MGSIVFGLFGTTERDSRWTDPAPTPSPITEQVITSQTVQLTQIDEESQCAIHELMSSHENLVFEDMLYASNEPRVIERVHDLVERMHVYLFEELGHNRSKRQIVLARRRIRTAKLHAICKGIVESQKEEWKLDSTRYASLLLEYEVRIQCISLLMTTRGSML